jgi:uncharacterized protein YukE
MSGDYRIVAVYGAIDTAGEALAMQHRALDELNLEFHQKLERVTWISGSNEAFREVMRRYKTAMDDLHTQLFQLGQALKTAGVNLNETDRYIANNVFGGGQAASGGGTVPPAPSNTVRPGHGFG